MLAARDDWGPIGSSGGLLQPPTRNWRLIVFPRYVPSVQRCMLASRAPNGCASTLPRPPICMAEAWPPERRPANSLRDPHASIREMEERND